MSEWCRGQVSENNIKSGRKKDGCPSTQYYTTESAQKAYVSVLKYAPCHEDVWGNIGIVPSFSIQVSGKFKNPAVLAWGKVPLVPIELEAEWAPESPKNFQTWFEIYSNWAYNTRLNSTVSRKREPHHWWHSTSTEIKWGQPLGGRSCTAFQH
jgi:hypothetical protein